jgi:hypothetical protein
VPGLATERGVDIGRVEIIRDWLNREAGSIGSAHTGTDTARRQIRQRPTGSPHIRVMHLDLSDEETAALTQELHDIVESDHYPFSPRIRTLRAILAKLMPEPVREPLPPRREDAPPRVIRGRRRG